VRELENAIEHAVVMAKSETVVPGDLPFYKERHQNLDDDDDDGPAETHGEPFGLSVRQLSDLPFADAKRRALDAFEQTYLAAVLARAGGNVSEAARQAGLDRSNFRRVLKKQKRPS
jgi:DNA-binding NtrC family response regulator